MPDYITFNRLMHLLDPETLETTISLHHRLAREKYTPISGYTVASWQEYMSKTTHYAKYNRRTVHHNETVDYIAWSDVMNAVKLSRSNVEADYVFCRRTHKGGILKTYDAIADAIRMEHEQHYMAAVVLEVDPLDHGHIREIMEAYYHRFAKHLPFELRSIDNLTAHWEDVLLNHARFIDTVRAQVGAFEKEPP